MMRLKTDSVAAFEVISPELALVLCPHQIRAAPRLFPSPGAGRLGETF